MSRAINRARIVGRSSYGQNRGQVNGQNRGQVSVQSNEQNLAQINGQTSVRSNLQNRGQATGRRNTQNHGSNNGRVRPGNIGSSHHNVRRRHRNGRSIDGQELMDMVNEQQMALDTKYSHANGATYTSGQSYPQGVNAIADAVVAHLN